ncbi:ATP-binding protein [Helicobacter sp. NHP19-003]|uniref:ATP-binding protein n=1 Tax=Helicobacter gastrocanis TaxID=2849641 RepID=A0ABN6I1V3_9HELI|nr:ATP-binding protein [Helicobacter sp. NHP19-003]BCZ16812.1 ATP-binding protein [Helicobacter sp. NHP19-003]
MDLGLLNNILENSLTQSKNLKPRNMQATPSTLLYGGAKAGKSSIAILNAAAYKRPVFVDCTDERLHLAELFKVLPAFCQDKSVDLLILKHPPKDFPLLNLPTFITQSTPKNAPKGFKTQPILPLSFAEFIRFHKKEPSTLLARFLKEGNLPELLFCPASEIALKKQALYALTFKDKAPLFKALLPYQTRSLSTHHLYTQLKKTLKISKDSLYAFIAFLQESQTLLSLPSPNRPKLYFYAFSLPYAFSHTHPLPPVFENMLALELIHNFGMSKISCHFNAFLVDHRHLCIPSPFPTLEQLNHTLPLLLKGVATNIGVWIVTINTALKGTCGKHAWQAHGFGDFCLQVLPTL